MSDVGANAAGGVAVSGGGFPWPRAAAVCVASLAVLLLIYADTVAGLAETWWESSAYGHALLVLPIAVWLIWRDRQALSALAPRPQWLALLLIPVGAAGWFLGELLSIRVARELALYGMFVAVVLATLGWRVTWRLGFPLAYILLCIPLWSVFIPPLQDMTAVVSARSLQALGFPVYLEGHYMHIPHGQFVVEEVCAGLRFLLATMAIVALHARLSFHTSWRAWVLFIAGVVSAVVFNWLRVDIIVASGHLFGMQFWLVTNHIEFGWVMFLVSLVPVIWLANLLHEPDEVGSTARDPQAGAAPTARHAAVGALALALAALGPATSAAVQGGGDLAGAAVPSALPPVPGVVGPEPGASVLEPVFQGADAELAATYGEGEGEVSVHLAYYATQSEGKEVVNDAHRLVADSWSSGGAMLVPVGGVDGVDQAREMIVRSGAGETRVLWSWYFVAGRYSTHPLEAKLLQVLDLPLLGDGPSGAAVVVLSARASSTGLAETRELLSGFGAELLPRLKDQLARADKSP